MTALTLTVALAARAHLLTCRALGDLEGQP